MPGARLSHQDRQHIAAGLVEGRGYAEIARRLRRPVSTVSREVIRNGGPEGYRADQAHRMAGRPDRRGQPPPAGDGAAVEGGAAAGDGASVDGAACPAAACTVGDRLAAVMVRTGV